MLPDRVSNPGPLTYESGALPIALRGPARNIWENKNMGETFLLILQMLIYWLCFFVLCLPKEYIRILFLPEKANFSVKLREAQKLVIDIWMWWQFFSGCFYRWRLKTRLIWREIDLLHDTTVDSRYLEFEGTL